MLVRSWPAPQVPTIPGSGSEIILRHPVTGERHVVAAGRDIAQIYTCGITPYDATHMGHASTYVHFDVLKRALMDTGRTVRHTQNVTDVDDPLLERAAATGVDWQNLAREQEGLFAADMTTLGVIPPSTYLGAVEAISETAPVIARLLEVGAAYRIPVPADDEPVNESASDVYADLSVDRLFATECGLTEAQMTEIFGERGGDPDRAGKRDRLDPLLWRAAREGEPSWDGGVLGHGRPGWHVECTVIARLGLPGPFDVQTGGSDLAFPHHAMSASHARIAYDNWAPELSVHTGMVAFDGEKMSKSLGNLVLVSKLVADGTEPMDIRLAILSHHYTADWEWTDELLDAAGQRRRLWLEALSGNGGAPTAGLLESMRGALADDLDAPSALEAMDEWCVRTLTGDTSEHGGAGIASRAVNALLGIRL